MDHSTVRLLKVDPTRGLLAGDESAAIAARLQDIPLFSWNGDADAMGLAEAEDAVVFLASYQCLPGKHNRKP
jgi:hypothetical protein